MTTTTNPIVSNASHTPGPWNDDGQFIVAPDRAAFIPIFTLLRSRKKMKKGGLPRPNNSGPTAVLSPPRRRCLSNSRRCASAAAKP
jgi:hypothetical protein